MIDIGHAHRGSAFRDQGWNIQLYAADGVCVPAPLRGWHMKTPMPFHLAAPRLSQARPHHPPGIGRWKGDRFGCQATYLSYKHTHNHAVPSAYLGYGSRVEAACLGGSNGSLRLQCARVRTYEVDEGSTCPHRSFRMSGDLPILQAHSHSKCSPGLQLESQSWTSWRLQRFPPPAVCAYTDVRG